MPVSHGGKLLVATPVIGDPNFERTVVLVLEHTDEGALGLVLNRPSELDLLDPLPQWYGHAAAPSVVFVGGPVEQERAIGLASASSADRDVEGFERVLGGLGTVDLTLAPGDVGDDLREVRVFAGYAGWGPGQLEDEIDAGAWFVVESEPADAFSADPETLWADVLRRQPGRVSLFSLCPPDPSMN